MSLEYINKGSEGKNSCGRYVGSVLLILFMWMIVGGIFTVIIDIISRRVIKTELAFYLALNVGFIFFLLGIAMANKSIHKRTFKSLITPKDKISWNRFFIGFGVYFLLVAISSVIEYFIEPTAVSFYSSLPKLLMFLPLAVIFTFIQTSTEELFFRGYILQGFGQRVKNPITLAIISGVIFMVPHLANPEVSKSMLLLPPYYFGVGFIFALVTLKSNSLELAIGAHAANNFFGAFVMNFKGSALEGTYSIWLTSRFSPEYNLISFVIIAILFYFILFNYLKVDKKY